MTLPETRWDLMFCWDSVDTKDAPTQPAAGADFSYTVPAGFRGLLSLFVGKFVASGDAANRGVLFTVTRGTHTLFRYPTTGNFANQTAGVTSTYVLGIGLTASDGADQIERVGPLPDKFELKAGDIIATTTTNIDNAAPKDQWTIGWIYKEFKLV